MKVCIIGVSGAGKTTLAKKLSAEFSIPAYSYDDVYWDKRSGAYIKNPQDVIDARVAAIRSEAAWIAEGSYDRRMRPFFEDCELIIRLNTPYPVCAARIIKRYLLSKIIRTPAKETLKNTLELLRFAKTFNGRLDSFFNSNPVLKQKITGINDIKWKERFHDK